MTAGEAAAISEQSTCRHIRGADSTAIVARASPAAKVGHALGGLLINQAAFVASDTAKAYPRWRIPTERSKVKVLLEHLKC